MRSSSATAARAASTWSIDGATGPSAGSSRNAARPPHAGGTRVFTGSGRGRRCLLAVYNERSFQFSGRRQRRCGDDRQQQESPVPATGDGGGQKDERSEEHTSELQSTLRITESVYS